MTNTSSEAVASDTIANRSSDLFSESQEAIYRRTDRLFANLMIFQWFGGIVAALWLSPKTWIGASSSVHLHVWAALLLGAAITAFPVFLARRQPGAALTRHVIAAAQMLTSALLIHLSGGRIETHFHVFGSLAFLAFYRDWRVLVTATIVVALDHFLRGLFWPQSVFGILAASPWRWLEHAAWVLFEDAFLIISIRQSRSDMVEVAARRSRLEALNADIENQVAQRTAELTLAHKDLQASEQRFRMLCASAPIGIFQSNAAGCGLYTNAQWQKIAGLSFSDSLGDGWQRALHPEDANVVIASWAAAAVEGREFNQEFRFRLPAGDVRWVNTRSAPVRSDAGELLGHVGTVEDVTERKRAEAELEAVHKQLLDASRQAGMAEVATGVLHNVGNVLNSVNVTSTLLADSIKKSRLSDVARLAGLLETHRHNLKAFLESDPKGQRVVQFLSQLARRLAEEQRAHLKELESLQKNIGHIKDIVTMQQTYAKVSGVTEIVRMADLLEDSLRMHATSLARHDVCVFRDFAEVPPITVDRHKVVQILVNLIRNAKNACDETGRADKRLAIRLRNGDDRIKISIADNGIGIGPENISRIFNHGFTTKKDGHGFGLHSGALAARELGGSLTVHSDGPGKGATFTLELPANNNQCHASLK